eukprot:CAMPEP_0115184464 /NCGR_PEP_ID=MMETSP0270-20121206/8976_1 /TAXON_ID=71861 /ORGANISM="Scrippsiella trochoidea, Strain CCMP3099" /LENGTH=44 /DNA_ID= /DNA_START= /DNA_END= /DNA_ORIENTATION=
MASVAGAGPGGGAGTFTGGGKCNRLYGPLPLSPLDALVSPPLEG